MAHSNQPQFLDQDDNELPDQVFDEEMKGGGI